MRIFENIDLYKYNTMRLHSIADVLYIPESIEELKDLLTGLKKRQQSFHILAAGSNIVFLEHVILPVISLMEIDKSIEVGNDGKVVCGCSIRIQTLINALKSKGFGGIEYLYSVPSSVGGAIYMNAGRGKKWKKAISDYLHAVDYIDINTLTVVHYKVAKGDFAYRNSIFQNIDCIIIRGYFLFPPQDKAITERLIHERTQYSKQYLEPSKPSCGSVFNKANPIIMRLLRGARKGDASFSSKTPNWISNNGNATASDILALIKYAKQIHKLLLLKYKLEIYIFK